MDDEAMEDLKAKYLESSEDEPELPGDEFEERKYEVDEIVDESVDVCGKHRFKVKWKDWKRKSDGTSTTWVKPEQLTNADEALDEWKIEKKLRIMERRKKYAETGYPVALFTNPCFTRFNTTLEELGLGEDQELTPDMVFPSYLDTAWEDWDAEVEDTRKRALAYMESTGMDLTQEDEDVPMTPSPPVHPPTNLKAEKGKTTETDRTKLQDAWDRATRQEGAASVVLVNEVDEELIPSSIDLATFQYIELGPYRHDGSLASHTDFLAGCTCEDGCLDSQTCNCQAEELAGDVNLIRGLAAYDQNGRYRFLNTAVTECNDNCQCDFTCSNRVAQRPRDIPLEVFKTQDRGWGVRATTFIERGKVLGTFTGELVPSSAGTRNAQNSQEEEEADEYSYELDWFDQAHQWRVTAKNCGNWSRFLNHSCYPNVKVYAVLYDSVMDAGEDNRHRLGFVATRDIEPRTELMINYAPRSKPAASGKCCEYGKCIRFE